MNNILTQNDGNNQLGIGTTQINILGITGNMIDITQNTTSFMSISNSSSAEKISVKKPTTLNNNLLTIKSTTKIENAATNSLFYIDDNNELKTLGIGTTNEYLRMGFNRPAWGPKTFVESSISGIGSIGYLEELKIDDDKLIGIGSTLGVKDSSISNIIQYDTNKHTSLIMSNGVGIGTLTFKTKYDTNFLDISLKKVDDDFSSNPSSKSLEIVDAKTYKYTINDLSDNSIHYYNLNISDINSSVTSSPTKKYHHITLRRDNQSPLINSLTPNDGSIVVANDSNIQFVFNESVTTGIGSIKIEPANGYGIGTTFIDITSGLINFSQTNVSNDTLTINPSSNFSNLGIQYTVSMVPEVGVIKDLAGNNFNLDGLYDFLSKDEINPQMTISSSTVNSGVVSNDTSISLTFTTTEATTNFSETDITKNNGSLSSFSGSGTTYTATFTPSGNGACTIGVDAGVYTDSQGNNNIAATQFVWTFDNIGPTMTITSTTSGVSDGSTTNDTNIFLTFTSSEPTTNFTSGDITNSNGFISNFTAVSSTVYTATFTPSGTGVRTVACTIDVAGGAFTDAVGNNNTPASQFNWTFDSILPGMTITSTTSGVTDGSTTNDTSISLTFTSTEATTNFVSGDINAADSVGNVYISNFQAFSSTVYTATFTPLNNGACTIDVASNKFTDAADNNNTAAPQFNWTFDGTGPTMTITSNTSGVSSGSTSSGTPVSLIFTSNESTTNFSISDITVSNGSLNSFSGSGTTYTATFTPTASGTCSITVSAGAYTDTAGNNNTAGSLSWTFVAPVNGNTSVDWTLVNTSSSNPTSSSSSYADPTYNDGATWIMGGYQGSGKSPWHGIFEPNATSGFITSHDTSYSSSIVENRKSWSLFEHTSNVNAFSAGYYTLSRVYERIGLDHYSGGSTNDPSHGLKLKFNTTVGGDSNTPGVVPNPGSWAGNGNPWGMFGKLGFYTSSTSAMVVTMATRGGNRSANTPSKIIMDFNKYIALTTFEWPRYQYYGYSSDTHLYYWNESLPTPAWTEIIHFYSAFWGAGSVYFRKNNTGSDQGNDGSHYTHGSAYNNGKNVDGGYSGSFNQDIPREPIIRLRFPTSYSNGSYVKNFVRQVKYARYYKIEELGSTDRSAGMGYYAKIKAIIPPQTALY